MSKHIYNLDLIPKDYQFKLNWKDKIIFAGSCFSEHISHKLKNYQFNVIDFPNGILFNPISLAQPFLRIKNNSEYEKNDLVSIDNIFKSWYHHGKVFSEHVDEFISNLNEKQKEFQGHVFDCDYLFVTFGSAFAYELKDSNQIVANCHKVDQNKFTKVLLSIDQIVQTWNEVLKTLNPKTKIIFTISPVKHLRDGIENNFLSKSILRSSIEEILKNNSNVYYFPSYELVTDDLRDYRFYENDGAHPNSLAIDYVFNKFKDSFFNKESMKTIDMIEKLYALKNHKMINNNKNEIKKFQNNLLDLEKRIFDLIQKRF